MTAAVHYAIAPADPAAHLFHVTVSVEEPEPSGQRFMLPAWNPGSYMIREFARHVVRITALAGERKLRVRKLDKHTWLCDPSDGPITLAYEVYARDHSVRAAYLDQTQAFFNGACVFLLPLGCEHAPCQVDILPPSARLMSTPWRVITGLKPARGTRRLGFGTYLAANYEALIDCPVQMGHFGLAAFDVHGTPHDIAITGAVPKLDLKRLAADLKRLCETQVALFEPKSKKAPFARYSFLTRATSQGYGGLEHRNSSALLCKRDDLPHLGLKDSTKAYRNFLGLVSHEYFHSWLVKRIRPAAFIPYQLDQENYTTLLWVFEGFTAYYDDLMLLRSGLISAAQYLEALTKTITYVTQRPARSKQSVAEASFDAWIKFYRADENAPNALVSYYQSGALVALALDLTIRARTAGKRSLDDVMRWLWRQHQDAGDHYPGLEEEGMLEAIEAATGLALAREVREWTQGTRLPAFAELFEPLGIEYKAQAALDDPAFAMLGIKTQRKKADLVIAAIYDDSPARRAGLAADDTLIALDQLRISAANLDTLLARYAPGDHVAIHVFRDDELLRLDVQLANKPPQRATLKLAEKPNKKTKALREAWLASKA
ncbi:MAG TPA: PDZ domain-containing protein [Burkholderiaceae bacterium]|nr:PDZ domain-containing protein [Burkholderiaceae bacterium]